MARIGAAIAQEFARLACRGDAQARSGAGIGAGRRTHNVEIELNFETKNETGA
jgi:hypothetical protein